MPRSFTRFNKPGTEFKEMKTIRTIFKVAESKIIDPNYFEGST